LEEELGQIDLATTLGLVYTRCSGRQKVCELKMGISKNSSPSPPGPLDYTATPRSTANDPAIKMAGRLPGPKATAAPELFEVGAAEVVLDVV